jgi:hypothetical protein
MACYGDNFNFTILYMSELSSETTVKLKEDKELQQITFRNYFSDGNKRASILISILNLIC